MTSSASISGFLFGNAADIYPDQAFSCFVGKTVQFARISCVDNAAFVETKIRSAFGIPKHGVG